MFGKLGAGLAGWSTPTDFQPVGNFARGVAMYAGNDNAVISQANTWLGRPVDYQTVFFNQTSWANFESSIAYIADFHKARYNLWSVPLAAAYGTVTEVAAGSHDAVFLACARAIMNAAAVGQAPNTPILIRTGWEFNLLGQEQSAFDGSPQRNPIPAAWVAAYRRVVMLFRGISNRFKFIWCLNNGDLIANGLTVTDCWPGDDAADYVAADLYYDSTYSNPAPQAGADTFGYDRTRTAGLDWLAAFAATHNKPIMIPEWGCNSNQATAWMSGMLAWMKANNVVLQGYWNSNAAIATRLSDNALPALASLYLQYTATPVVTSGAAFNSAQNANFAIQLTSNQDSIYAVTWEVVSGAATVAGSTLTVAGAPAGNVQIVVRAKANGLVSPNFTITHTFVVPYTMTDSNAAAYIAALPNAPSETFKAAVDGLVIDLKAAGSTAWAKARDIFIAADTAANSKVGLKLVASRVAFGTPAFVPYEGFIGNYASNSYLRYTNIAGQAPSPGSLNSLWVLAWERQNISTGTPAIGLPSSNPSLNPRNGANAQYSANDWTSGSVANADGRGIWSMIRSAANARRLRKESTTVHSDTQASATATTSETWMEDGSNTSFADAHQLRVVLIGSAPTDAQEAATTAAFRKFYTALGQAS